MQEMIQDHSGDTSVGYGIPMDPFVMPTEQPIEEPEWFKEFMRWAATQDILEDRKRWSKENR